MLSDMALKLLLALLTKIMTETFLAKILIAVLNSWAKTTANKLDDKVVAAMADALGVPVEEMPKP